MDPGGLDGTQPLLAGVPRGSSGRRALCGLLPVLPARLAAGYVHANALLPGLIVLVFLDGLHSILLTIVVFQLLCMIALPLYYVSSREGGAEAYVRLLRRLLVPWRSQLRPAAAGFVAMLVGSVFWFPLARFVPHGDVEPEARADGLNFPPAGMLVFAVYFTIVNATLEELFWRVYLLRELGLQCSQGLQCSRGGGSGGGSGGSGGCGGSGGGGPVADLEAAAAAAAASSAATSTLGSAALAADGGGCGGASSSMPAGGGPTSRSSSLSPPAAAAKPSGTAAAAADEARGGSSGGSGGEGGRILVSCYYAAYHVVVVLAFCPGWVAAAAFVGLVAIGRALAFIREHERLGLLTAVGVHMGLDAALCVIVASIYYTGVRRRLLGG